MRSLWENMTSYAEHVYYQFLQTETSLMSVIALFYIALASYLELAGNMDKLIKEGNHKDETNAPEIYYLNLKHTAHSFICLSSDTRLRAFLCCSSEYEFIWNSVFLHFTHLNNIVHDFQLLCL